MVNSANDTYDYYIFASIATISSSSTVDCDIEYSIKQIDYVHDDDYVHTDNNYTTVDKSKLSGIAAGAEVNVNADWNVTDSTADAYIFNKPQIGDGTIYIEKNSTPIANFKVNQTTDSHVNISLNKNDVGLS
jgi:hypothetical protein